MVTVGSSIDSSNSSMSEDAKPSKRLKHKAVRFAPGCKTFDGLASRASLFEHCIHRLFLLKLPITEVYVMTLVGGSLSVARDLLEDFRQLIARMRGGICEETKSSFPLLSAGGGANHRLVREHFPFVLMLGKVVEACVYRMENGLPFPMEDHGPAAATTAPRVSGTLAVA